jgi:predicted SAM-dependent methyltransferase
LLNEVCRILRPNGEFLIAVPDASIYVDAYIGKRDADELMQYKPAITSGKSMDVLNYIFYMDGHHKFMFDSENLAFHCEAAGFVSCSTRPFDPTLDMAARDYESLYMSCRKQEGKAL